MLDRHYKSGTPREQGFLLPPSVEDYVSSTNPVRAIDAYVDSLDFTKLGFRHSHGRLTPGQPAYSPSDLLKLYLYGYLNRIRSSRRLEQETHRNLEVMWLLKGLRPSYKTISNFRKDNLAALQLANKDFVLLCKELNLYGGDLVGIDGSFFSGNASKASIKTKGKLKKQLRKIELDIAQYFQEIEAGDEETEVQSFEDKDLGEKIAKLKKRQKECEAELNDLDESGQTQLSSTDPDARLLSKGGQRTAGYNVQTAVDDKHKLIAVCDVVNDGNDTNQLYPMSRKAKDTLGEERLEVTADSGYYNQVHLKNCHEAGITPYVAIPVYNGKTGRFKGSDFEYDAGLDAYKCPAGRYLSRQSRQNRSGKIMIKYASKSSQCRECKYKDRCLPKKTPYRQLHRYEYEDLVVAHQKRMNEKGEEYMRRRASISEHPFGTLKVWCGWTHFLLRGLDKVRAEMSLLMLSYNFKRVLNIIGIDVFRAYCQRRKLQNTDGSCLSGLYCALICSFQPLWGRSTIYWMINSMGKKNIGLLPI